MLENEQIGVPFVAGSTEIHRSDLLPDDPGGVTEHPEFEQVAQIWGPAPGVEPTEDTESLDADDEVYYSIGRLRHLYFEYDHGPCQWSFSGWYENDSQAIDATIASRDGLTAAI